MSAVETQIEKRLKRAFDGKPVDETPEFQTDIQISKEAIQDTYFWRGERVTEENWRPYALELNRQLSHYRELSAKHNKARKQLKKRLKRANRIIDGLSRRK